ncbi:restriction endonuclease [Planococcus donghaensis MPA1U2]|uniref:Restriction endonuclease n=1 Tax=Planococcus donghaensis MPA1U2 TaxID=933115 RepID=E7REG1_9BACL|nr:restriction endonuclease [Planococcus donghaensis MPA1U2]
MGIKAVQEISAAKLHYGANEAWVVTNSFFTKAASELATSNHVKLVNRDQLMKILLEKKTE